jgi:hypothetical protein
MVLDPEHLWTSALRMGHLLPALLGLVTDLVVITAADGTVGRGVVIEVADARRRGVRVGNLSDSSRFTNAATWSFARVEHPTL